MYFVRSVFICILVTLISGICLAEEFPYRKDYPDVKIVELEDLKAGYDNGTFIIVDVRSKIEFDTIHIKGAVHDSLSSKDFTERLKSIVDQNAGKKIAVYCNGITCTKSYIATQKAQQAGMDNVYAFDAGIPAWAKAYPSDTRLVGKTITDPARQLIPKSEFKKLLLDYDQFKKMAEVPNAMVIDVRDPIQRTHKLPGFEDAVPITLDKLIKNIINHERMKDKRLLIFDQVGKQVRWLMYYLEDKGYDDYYFLNGGATSVLKEQEYR